MKKAESVEFKVQGSGFQGFRVSGFQGLRLFQSRFAPLSGFRRSLKVSGAEPVSGFQALPAEALAEAGFQVPVFQGCYSREL